jgi:AraC-like DNA-binding protein
MLPERAASRLKNCDRCSRLVGMDYREMEPPPRLRRHLVAFWRLRNSAADGRRDGGRPASPGASEPPAGEPILPDGRCEIILHRGQPYQQRDGTGWRRQERALWAGQLLGPLVLRPSGPTDLFGIRFTPWGAAALLRGRLADTTGSIGPLGESLPGAAAALEDAAASAGTLADFARRAALLLGPLLRAEDVDSLVVVAARRLETHAGRVEALAGELGVSRRHLERRFLREVGLPPKRYARIVRFQRLLSALREAPPGGGAEAAAELDYADQPHAVREFREFAGVTPSSLLADVPRLTALFAGWTAVD